MNLKFLQSGRSMVEMLGVLAIIGVLSVGGLEGYSRAMFKHKLNTMNDQVNTILSVVSRYKNDLKISDLSVGQYPLIPILRKLNEIPENMFHKNDSNSVYDVFGNFYHIYHHNTGYIGIISRINNDHNQALDICRNLFMIAKNYHSELDRAMIRTSMFDDPQNTTQYLTIYGDKFCTQNSKCLKNISLKDADQYCNTYKNSDELLFYFTFS